MNNPIGILQGRLTPSNGRGIQFFPSEEGEWEFEFERAGELGLSHIQWACDTVENPILDAGFRKKVLVKIDQTGIPVKNMDVQFLVKLDIAQCSEELIERVCQAVAEINAGNVEIPLLESSSLLDSSKRVERLSVLERFIKAAQRHAVHIAIETDLPPQELTEILTVLPSISVVYDSGNSAHMGYDVSEEFAAYRQRVSNIHIKDRLRGGGSVALGTGNADFPRLFEVLKRMEYAGPITLQPARGADGDEIKTVAAQIVFVNNYMTS